MINRRQIWELQPGLRKRAFLRVAARARFAHPAYCLMMNDRFEQRMAFPITPDLHVKLERMNGVWGRGGAQNTELSNESFGALRERNLKKFMNYSRFIKGQIENTQTIISARAGG